MPPPFTHDGDVVFSPHIYRGGLTPARSSAADFERARNDAANFGGAPVFVGEWGSGPERAEDPADMYFRDSSGTAGRVPLLGDAVDVA